MVDVLQDPKPLYKFGFSPDTSGDSSYFSTKYFEDGIVLTNAPVGWYYRVIKATPYNRPDIGKYYSVPNDGIVIVGTGEVNLKWGSDVSPWKRANTPF